jgi:hypothetical protein
MAAEKTRFKLQKAPPEVNNLLYVSSFAAFGRARRQRNLTPKKRDRQRIGSGTLGH